MKLIKRKDVLKYIDSELFKSGVIDSYKELKLFCAVEGINATKQTIKAFLVNKAKEDGVNLYVENLVAGAASKRICEREAAKYKFHREDLQYFNDLFRIYTTKCLRIGNIISMIVGRRLLDSDLMDELDITINEEYVLLSDIDRLLVPLKHNYALALAIKFKAEQLETYYNLNVARLENEEAITKILENLPSEELQDYFGLSSDSLQFIPLTEKQLKAIEENTLARFQHYMYEDNND